jgi:hypothetical protein
MNAMPKEFKTDALQEKLYYKREADDLGSLTPAERAAYDTRLKPVYDQNDVMAANIKELAPKSMADLIDFHTMRIRKRGTMPNDVGLGGKSRDPMTNDWGLSTGRKTPMFDRLFKALEDVNGKRIVVSPREEGDGINMWVFHHATPAKIGGVELKAGNIIDVPGAGKFVVREAMTPEIEQHANFQDGKPARYYHNALISAYAANHYLAQVLRNLQFMEELKVDPLFLNYATKDASDPRVKRFGWDKTTMPQFNGPGNTWYMDPRLRYVMDDYNNIPPGSDALQWIAGINRAVTKLIFITPTPHVLNVLWHGFVHRGVDWINPAAYPRYMATSARAITSVWAHDDLQTHMHGLGMGLMYRATRASDPMQLLFNAAGAKLLRDPVKWDPIAKILGVNSKDLLNSVYNASRNAMWLASDVITTQAYLENRLKGMTDMQAMHTTEAHVPPYKLPTTVVTQGMGGRAAAKALKSPLISFGPYHYGLINSFAHIVKDAVSANASPSERIDAFGKLMALGLLMYVVKPAADKLVQKVTGDEDAESAPRGPMVPLSMVAKAARGETDVGAVARGIVTISPLTTFGISALAQRDFTGREVLDPGTFRDAMSGDMSALAKVLVEEGDFAARGLVSPYGLAMNSAKKYLDQDDENPFSIAAKTARDVLLDFKVPTEGTKKYRDNLDKYLQQKTRMRERHPRSLAEEWINNLTR